MKYDFETVLDRRNTGCIKWDHILEECDEDAIPAWVADMDFLCAPEIVAAIKERASHEVFGYTKMKPMQYDAVINWVKTRHGYDVKREWIIQSAGVVCSLNALVDELLPEGGTLAMNSPCYPPFFSAASGGGHKRYESRLVPKDGRYVMDMDDLERGFKEGAKVFVLCNPHNPVGRAWTYDELYALGELCEKYGVYVISDDIHCDLMLPVTKYVPAMTVPTLKDRTATLISATKTFNIAGLQASTAIVPDTKLRKKMYARLMRYGHWEPNIFGIEAQYAAYTQCADWVDEAVKVIGSNINYMMGVLEKTPLKVIKPEATYLLWANCSDMKERGREMFDFFIKKAKICPSWGKAFGDENFIRLNLAAPRSLIEQIGERIKKVFE